MKVKQTMTTAVPANTDGKQTNKQTNNNKRNKQRTVFKMEGAVTERFWLCNTKPCTSNEKPSWNTELTELKEAILYLSLPSTY